MQITYGALHEAYKIAGRKRIRADIKTAPHSIDLMAGQSDFAAFNVFVSVDDAFSLHVGEHAWFTQRGDVPTVRLACDLPVHAELYHEQTHRIHLPFEYFCRIMCFKVFRECWYEMISGQQHILKPAMRMR